MADGTTNKVTRADYMDGKISHHEFYSAVAMSAGITLANSELLPRIIAALASGDEHLNTIPLQMWDDMVSAARPVITRALKEHGDFYSMAGGVCVMKAAARNAAIMAR